MSDMSRDALNALIEAVANDASDGFTRLDRNGFPLPASGHLPIFETWVLREAFKYPDLVRAALDEATGV